MRIAIAYDCLYPWTTGGAEKLYSVFASEFSSLGHDVTYVTRRQWSANETPSELFRVVPVSDVEIYDSRGVRRVAASLVFARSLFSHFVRNRGNYDAVYVSALPVLNVFAMRLALLGSRIPIVFDWPEIWNYRQSVGYSGRLVGTIAFLLQRIAIGLTPAATVYGPSSVRNWRSRGGRKQPTVLGLIDDSLTAAPQYAKVEPPFALYVGRHIPDKQVQSIPAAIAAARAQVPGLRAVILGDGPARAAVERAIADADADAFIELPGFVDPAELTSYLGDAAILVHPSKREGFGMVVVEAAARATPAAVVAGEENAAVDLITEGVNGFIAQSAAATDLAAAIVAVLSRGDELRRSTAAWFESFREQGTMKTSARRILALFESAARH